MLDLPFLREMEQLHVARTPFCMATIVDGRGSIPQIIGAKALFTLQGRHTGTVGGGSIEAKIEQTAQELLTRRPVATTHFVRWSLQRDIGMTCGGEVAVYFEVMDSDLDWSIHLFGAGHIAQQLCRHLVDLDCRITCIDTRQEWLDRLPAHDHLQAHRVENFADGVADVPPMAYVIVMTQGHQTDLPVLEALAREKRELAYLGVIGSDNKARLVRRELSAAGVPDTFIDSMTCPIGDKVGNNTPVEISFGIVSQLLRHRREADDQ